jgi:nicotinate-nucleotide adenylyltransferase
VRLGLLGGTFNPPHIAHLVCAQEARAQLDLARVVLVPAAVPPHKEVPEEPGVEHRLAMCRRAAALEPWLEVAEAELERPGPSYTVDTLRELHARAPEDELTFIVGGDMALSLPSWREPDEILRVARLGVAERAAAARAEIAAALEPLSASDRVSFFAMPRLDVSSTDMRARVRAGRPIRWLVPDPVADYIGEHGLYRGGAEA